jgi:hypothetical protein
MFQRALLLFFTLAIISPCLSQQKAAVKKDLSAQWLIYGDHGYEPLTESNNHNIKSIHFSLEASQYPTDRLHLWSAKPYSVFVNGMMIKATIGLCQLSIDSLSASQYSNTLNISIYQKRINLADLSAKIISTKQGDRQADGNLKPRSYFRDFVVTAGLIIIIFFVAMIRVHPKLAADYFSVKKILSLREGEDNQSQARFVISANVLFYVLCSLLLSLFFIIVFHHLPDNFVVQLAFKADNYWLALWQWIKLSCILVTVLFVKIILIFSLSGLFGIRGIAGIHFFNWIRLLLVITGALSVVIFIYFISRGNNSEIYLIMQSVIVFALVVWIVIVFLKLNNRTEHTMFHLFSYICATEVIPLLLTIKVLFH